MTRSDLLGPLLGATHRGQSGVPGEGPYTIIELRVVDGVIQSAAYQANGCPSAYAAASALCAIVIGRELSRAQTIGYEGLAALLGEVPEGKEAAVKRAITALELVQEFNYA